MLSEANNILPRSKSITENKYATLGVLKKEQPVVKNSNLTAIDLKDPTIDKA